MIRGRKLFFKVISFYFRSDLGNAPTNACYGVLIFCFRNANSISMIFNNRNISFLILSGIFLLLSCSKKPSEKIIRFIGETQGTYYAVTCVVQDSINLQPAIDSLFHRFDSSASTYKPNSIITRLNNNDLGAVADSTYEVIFRKAMEVSKSTNGAFDITVGPLVNAWGFGFSDRMKVDQRVVDSLMPLVGYGKVKLVNGRLVKTDSRIQIDYNAIAQGYAVDVLAAFLHSRGITSFLVDIGGEVLAKGVKPGGEKWMVGIEKPAKDMDSDREVEDVVSLYDAALSTSGNYRKYYEENGVRYSHTIDPSNGYPVKHSLLSVSVLAGDCMTADAYATAFMVMGLEKSKEYLTQNKSLNAYFIYSDSLGKLSISYTDGFKGILKPRE